MKSDEELYARYKWKLDDLFINSIETEMITSKDCPFNTYIYHGNDGFSGVCRLIKKHFIDRQDHWDLYPYCVFNGYENKECLFLDQVNRIAKQILTTIDKRTLTDNDLISYLKLHNLIKKADLPSDYDHVIRCIAEYCFENERQIENGEVMCAADAGYAVIQYVKRIVKRIRMATSVACLKDKSCPYKPLVKSIPKRKR